MIKFIDSANNKRGIEFSNSYNPKYIHLTLFADKNLNASTTQIPKELIQDIIDNLEKIK